MSENDVSYAVRGAAFKVYNTLGPGLLESVYEAAMHYELKKAGLRVRSQVGIPVIYDNVQLEIGFRADLVVEDKVIVELKSVETFPEVAYKVLRTYLRLSDKKLGLLINFNTTNLAESIRRVVNGL